MNNYFFKAVLKLWAALSCIFCTTSQVDWWPLGVDWSVQLLPGRVAFWGRWERGCLLPFWIVGSENKQSCLYSHFGLKWISLRPYASFVLTDHQCLAGCSGNALERKGWGLVSLWCAILAASKMGNILRLTESQQAACLKSLPVPGSNFHGDGGVWDKLFFAPLQNPFSGHP